MSKIAEGKPEKKENNKGDVVIINEKAKFVLVNSWLDLSEIWETQVLFNMDLNRLHKLVSTGAFLS